MSEVVIVDGVRTPIGSFRGMLKDVSAKDLAKTVMESIVVRNNLEPKIIDEIIVGCVDQPTNTPNIGRVASLELGFPKEIPAYMVSRNCASGLQALVSGYQSIKSKEMDTLLIVGTENMSQIPFLLRGVREGYKMRHQQLTDALWEMLLDPVANLLMGETAELLAKEFNISREAQDEFSYQSHRKAIVAQKKGIVQREIASVEIETKDGKQKISVDEGPNSLLSKDRLNQFKPVFKRDGTVTAGNSCSTNDGAASVLLMSSSKAIELGYKPRAKIVAYAFVGLEPERMGLGPVLAVPQALAKAGLSIEDIDIFELNEAFAAQSLACIEQLKLNQQNINIYGGAIALGHPVGATGVRQVVTLMNALETEAKQFGVVTLCIGGGLGGALVLENLNV